MNANDLPLSPLKALLEAELIARLGADRVLSEREDLRPYECDGLSAYRQVPLLAALPSTPAEVVSALAAAAKLGVPIVPRGQGTGLSGGAQPLANGLLLSTAKLKRMIAIDPLARLAVVEPGVRNLAISEAVAAYRLYYAPDPSSQIACSIGGNVAENSGGVHCLKYGLTVHNIAQVKLATIEGDTLTLGAHSLDWPGYDLLSLAVGSEGMLGIVTEVSCKLIAKPAVARVVMASFATVAAAGDAVASVIGAGIVPAGLEMMDKLSTQAAEDFVQAGYDLTAEAILLCESDGTALEVEEEIAKMIAVMRAAGATDCKVSTSEAERMKYWSGRKAAFPAVGRISADYFCIDGSIPRKALGQVLAKIAELSAHYGLRCANVFHAGDGNLHPLILFDGNVPGDLEKTEAFASDILELCVAVGGTITGEHGVGIEKINQMCSQFRPLELAQFRAVKRAFDPPGLLNPNKAIPTLNRCADYGAMRAAQALGAPSPHADLPRF